MSRIDHIAYRCSDRKKLAQFFIDAFGYKVQQEFPIVFDDGSKAECIALEPPEKTHKYVEYNYVSEDGELYHLAPEIFVSDGTPDSIVGKWVAAREKIGACMIHHIAYQVEDVRAKAKEWIDNGWGEFSGNVLTCPNDELTQIFSKPHPLAGVIFEFINRGKFGFCKENVQALMESTKDNK